MCAGSHYVGLGAKMHPGKHGHHEMAKVVKDHEEAREKEMPMVHPPGHKKDSDGDYDND